MLNKHSVLAEIGRIQEEGKSGVLLLEKDHRVIRIHFRNGLVEACSSDSPEHWLGQYLLKEGFLEAEEIVPVVEEARRRHVSTGEVAVDRKKLESAELLDVVRSQAFQLFKHAIENDFSITRFESGSLALNYPAGIDLQHLMLELARHDSESAELEWDRSFVLHGGVELSHLPWYPQELSILNELTYPRTLGDLAAATGLEYARLKKILNVFNNLHLIDFVDVVAGGNTALAVRSRSPFDFMVPEIRGTCFSDKLEIIHNESSFVSEQFKTLKVRLSEIPADKPVKAITVSSPHSADGKSLICANLALCFSKDPGRRVLVIDADLRNPSLHKYLGTSVEPGLVGYLQNGHLQAHCYLRRIDKLYILTAGGIAPNPVELLSLGKMRELIDYFKSEFDTILIDATPLAPISDARILMGLSDGLVMIVRRGKTGYNSIRQALKVMDPKKLLGVVFNDVKPMLFHTHYDHSYYRYGKGSLYPYSSKRIRHRSKNYLED